VALVSTSASRRSIVGATWDEWDAFPVAAEALLVDELVALAEAGSSEILALRVVKRWTEENDRSPKAFKRTFDLAFARFGTAPSVDPVLTVVDWLETSHPMWAPR
jgi:hypothetical protein